MVGNLPGRKVLDVAANDLLRQLRIGVDRPIERGKIFDTG
jgi:hypothetical protein